MIRRSMVATGAIAAVVLVAAVLAVGRVLPGPRAVGAVQAPGFVDERAGAGLATTYDGPSDDATGGGIAAFDCDEDGRPDLLIAGGVNPAGLYRNRSPVGGALRFEALADAGTSSLLGPGVLGAYPIDIDGDGRIDVALLRDDGLRLLHALGDCRFADATAALGLAGDPGWTSAFSATWEGTNRLPTLAVGRYLRIDEPTTATPDCDRSLLVRPAGADAGAYAPATPLQPGFCTLSMLFSDWDGSGRRDLRVSNDRQYYVDGEEQLWRVEPGVTPRLYTDADGWRRVQIWGMGIASYDVTGDGHPDVYLTSQADNKLQTLAAGPTRPDYRDIALARGVTVAQPFAGGEALPSTAWHPAFADLNDDGRIDLFVSKGNVNTMPSYAAKDPSNLLLGQPDGTFVEGAPAAGLVAFDRGRGAAVVDLNLDGLLDVVQVNYGQPVNVWRNVGGGSAAAPAPMGGWLEVRVTQPGPNRDAIGGWLEVRSGDTTSRRELTIGGGHLSGDLGWVHVGLGAATGADLRVIWPDGETGPWLHADANQFLDVGRGDAILHPWAPPR